MEFPLANGFNVSSAAYAQLAKGYPHIRMYTAGINTSITPLLELKPAPALSSSSNSSISQFAHLHIPHVVHLGYI